MKDKGRRDKGCTCAPRLHTMLHTPRSPPCPLPLSQGLGFYLSVCKGAPWVKGQVFALELLRLLVRHNQTHAVPSLCVAAVPHCLPDCDLAGIVHGEGPSIGECVIARPEFMAIDCDGHVEGDCNFLRLVEGIQGGGGLSASR